MPPPKEPRANRNPPTAASRLDRDDDARRMGAAALAEAISEDEEHLVRLEDEQRQIRNRLSSLRSALLAAAAAGKSSPIPHLPVLTDANIPKTPAEKVRLFRDLFRGRQDVYPTRFENKKTGKAGYAPACANKFVRGVCELPKVKCGDCTRQAFLPPDDIALLAHLKGQQVMGVYPLLQDETCWFLAVDFDEANWTEDVKAFATTCREAGLPVAIERSRSGNGAHVWFFFSAPVAAAEARKMACHLITETMSRRHELSMESYDRIFPSQDTMPRGGFGNLIALPLQHSPRQQGNSVFVDEALTPYPGDQQWAYLASIRKVTPAAVEALVLAAERDGNVLGVRAAGVTDDDEMAPWERRPSGKPRPIRIVDPLPREISAVLAQRLFVPKAALPSAFLNQIKRLAAFQNPEFYKKQSMRLSTARTPRVITCAEDLPAHIGLPRGCRGDLEALLAEHGITLALEDKRNTGEPSRLQFLGELTAIQKQAAKALLAHDIGVFVAPPGVGKTVVGTYLVAARACSTLILVHRRPLLDQWLAQLSLFLGIDTKAIGLIGAGKRKLNGRLDIAMIQSLVRRDRVDDLVAGYGHVIVDECHHLPAISFERVLTETKARFIVGLTATPQRRDGHHPITEMQLGPVRFAVNPKAHAAQRPFDHRLVVRETSFRLPGGNTPAIQDLYTALAANAERNHLILCDVINALETGRSPILLTERRDHLEYFAARLSAVTRHLVVLRGGMGATTLREAKRQLASLAPNQQRLVLATGRYIGEGFDDARLDTLFLALPISWKGTLVQYTGRLHRLHPGKTEVQIFDYVDREVPLLLRMFERRLRGYRAIGYARGEAPLGFGDELDEPVLRSQYDDFDIHEDGA
jgi:superfamily II DNA or RNA helicase